MVNILICRSWTFLSLLYTGIAIFNWSGPAQATQLLDIRVGEYDKFTRIVFDLDRPTPNPDIEIQSSGQLLITFKKASVNLIRKIPVERSRHLKKLQLWQRQGGLSALLIFDYPGIRIESFRLSDPPRFAVDIFPTAEQTKDNMTKRSDPLVPVPNESVPLVEKIDQPSKNGLATKHVQSTTHEQNSDITEKKTTPAQSVETTPRADNGPTAMAMEKVQPRMTRQRIPKPTKADSVDPQNSSRPSQNLLQLYLVVTLVIITIAILLLLILMLFTRQRLSDERNEV
ncbi:MAG: hypothetical protein PVI54_08320 [Desulfobacteraceae bacterium]|jgi:hypothetical protein